MALSKKRTLIPLLVGLLICFASCKQEKHTDNGWKKLWNGNDFDGWSSYLGTVDRQRQDSLGNAIPPIGSSTDPLGVFSVVDLDGEKAIRISGEVFGMLYTEQAYGNYHLKLKMKWGNYKHPLREHLPMNSGLLYHGQGDPGSAFEWMNAHELQLMQGQMGNYWCIGQVNIEIPSKQTDSVWYAYDPKAVRHRFYPSAILDTNRLDSLAKRRCVRAINMEKPIGKWNQVELIARGDSCTYVVNGQEVMRLFGSKDHASIPLKSGKIILQSEGSEVFFKEILLRRLETE